MQHQMKLWGSPFHSIQTGKKRIEMRLNDEKRQKIQSNDEILFTCTDTGEKLLCRVVKLHRYTSFEELYACFDKISLGYTQEEIAKPCDMLAYYSQEEISTFGVVGIEIEVLQ